MSQQLTVTGMVLSSTASGEYDKRVVILTKERGKISAFAKGARRPNNHLAGAVFPCAFGTFAIYEGRNSNSIQTAEISNYFAELRQDMDAACYAFYFLEFADYYTREGNDERKMLGLLYQSMRILTKKTIPLKLIRYIFELKAIAINGEGPQAFQCVFCGSREPSLKFSVKAGGLVCDKCKSRAYDVTELQTSTLYAIQYVIASPVEKVYTFTLKEDILKEFGKIVERYKDVYVEKRFKSLEILEELS